MKELIKTISYIVNRSTELKNKFTNASTAPVEFACIFCQNGEEYEKFTSSIQTLGKIIQNTPSGFTYLLNEPIKTVAGPLRLVKIRKPDAQRHERGDADFNTEYKNFKKMYQGNHKFELIKRDTFEMLRLSDPEFDVMACFSSVPMSKDLHISKKI
jgi:hypothetical protein